MGYMPHSKKGKSGPPQTSTIRWRRPKFIDALLGGNEGNRARSGKADELLKHLLADLAKAPNLSRLAETWRLWEDEIKALDKVRKQKAYDARRDAELRCRRARQMYVRGDTA